MEKKEDGKVAFGRVSRGSRHDEWERLKLRAKIYAVRSLLPGYGGRTVDNVLAGLESVYAYRYGGKKGN